MPPVRPVSPFPTSTAQSTAPPAHTSAVTALYSCTSGDTRFTADSASCPIMFPTMIPLTTDPRVVAITASMVDAAKVLKALLTR